MSPRKKTSVTGRDAEQYLEQCYRNGSAPRVDEFGHRHGMSRVTATARFKERYGITLSAYFRARCDERAKLLLKGAHMKIDEVALRSGHGTKRTLERSFKRQKRKSPAKFR